ncbi:MAG TPA: DNA-binding protein [Fusobacterium sp.]|uniref:DNA-binding protein n=1 Tax=Fusobacterium sp. TaxID=68766 RepID=UPI002F403B22
MKIEKVVTIGVEKNLSEEIMEQLVKKVGEFSNLNDLAEIFHISRTTICREIERGEIVAFHFGARVIVVTRSLQGIIEKFL